MFTRRWTDARAAAAVAALAFAGVLARAEARPASAESGEKAKASPVLAARVELGRRLFFDPAVTLAGMRSCADCHDPEHGFSDPDAKSLDLRGTTPHHAQTLIDVGNAKSFHWHGEVRSIADVVRRRTSLVGTYLDGFAMDDLDEPAPPRPSLSLTLLCGVPVRPTPPEETFVADGAKLERDTLKAVAAEGRYDEAFIEAYGTTAVSEERIATAIEAYCRTIRSGTSAYDRFAAGDRQALSASAQRGLAIFRGAGGCASCHSMTGDRATFTDQAVHDLHAEKAAADLPASSRRPAPRVARLGASSGLDALGDARLIAFPPVTFDPDGSLRKWKTPTLRDVARRGPYLHTGLAPTLEDAIRFFRPPDATPGVVPADRPWTDEQVADVAAFLRSLTSDERPGLPASTWSLHVEKTRLRFVDAGGAALGNLKLTFMAAGDPLPLHGEPVPVHATTSHDGRVTIARPQFTHLEVVFADGLRPIGGPMIPDTCQSTEIRLPIRGQARLLVTVSDAARAPETLVARHPTARFFPDRKAPVTYLRRVSVTPLPDGSVRATYDAPMRTDLPPECVVDLPGEATPRPVTLRREVAVSIDATR